MQVGPNEVMHAARLYRTWLHKIADSHMAATRPPTYPLDALPAGIEVRPRREHEAVELLIYEPFGAPAPPSREW